MPRSAALTWVADKASIDGLPGRRAAAPGRPCCSDSQGLRRGAQAARPAACPSEFEALAADRRGDIYWPQGKKDEAKAEYQQGLEGLERAADYRRLVEVKLNARWASTPEALAPPARPPSMSRRTAP